MTRWRHYFELTLVDSRNLDARSAVEDFVQCADHSAIVSISDEAVVADANTLWAVSILGTFLARSLVVRVRRLFVVGNLVTLEAVAFKARVAYAVIASVSVVALGVVGTDVWRSALVNVDASLRRFAVRAGSGESEAILALTLFWIQKVRNFQKDQENLTSKLSSDVGTQIELSPQLAVPSWHGFERSLMPTLLTVEMRTAFSCE